VLRRSFGTTLAARAGDRSHRRLAGSHVPPALRRIPSRSDGQRIATRAPSSTSWQGPIWCGRTAMNTPDGFVRRPAGAGKPKRRLGRHPTPRYLGILSRCTPPTPCGWAETPSRSRLWRASSPPGWQRRTSRPALAWLSSPDDWRPGRVCTHVLPHQSRVAGGLIEPDRVRALCTAGRAQMRPHTPLFVMLRRFSPWHSSI
jgi:hypothetical protein